MCVRSYVCMFEAFLSFAYISLLMHAGDMKLGIHRLWNMGNKAGTKKLGPALTIRDLFNPTFFLSIRSGYDVYSVLDNHATYN